MTEEKAIKILERTKRNCGLPEQGTTWKPNAETNALDMAIEALEKKKDNRWIPCSERFPDTDSYILLSFSNFTIPVVGRYEVDKDGSGAFYVGDELETCISQDLYVNAWQQLPKSYRESE